MSSVDELFESACQLPEAARLELIARLQNTVQEVASPFSQDQLDEYRKRVAEYDADPSIARPWEDVRRQALSRIDRKHD